MRKKRGSMKRFSLAIATATTMLLATSLGALGADTQVKLTLDGRPVDRTGGNAIARNGVVLADIVDLTRAFNGLLTFPDRTSVTVTLNGTTVRYHAGVKTANANDKPVALRAAPFMHNGDLFVPLQEFVAFGGATVALAPGRADIRINANPSSGGTPAPASSPSPKPSPIP